MRFVRRYLIPAAFYAIAAGALTWPLVIHPSALLGATDPSGDPSLYLWALGWNLQTLSTHPGWLFTGRVFDANIFFPARHTLAFSDHLLLPSIFVWPLYAATGDIVACYNVVLLGSLTAAAFAMHLLVREIGAGERAAYVGGLVFGFAPYHFTHLIHLQLQALYWLPLTFLFLHRVFAGRRWIDTIALGVVTGLQVASSTYYAVIGSIGLACAAGVLTVLTGRSRTRQLAGRLAAAAAIAALIGLPWTIPYGQVASETGAGRTLLEASRGSAVPASYFQAPPENLLYGRSGLLRPSAAGWLPRKDGPEQSLFPGLLALLLAAVGVLGAPREMRGVRLVYVALGTCGVVLSLGPDGLRFIYASLYDWLYGMQVIRAPARFSVLTLCAIAALASMGIRALEERSSRVRWAAVSVILALILAEYANGAIAYGKAPALTSGAGRWLRAEPGAGAVICLPLDFDRGNTPCMLQSLEHGRPIVNGYSGVRPSFYSAFVDMANGMPSAESLLAFHDLGVVYFVSDRPLVPEPALEGALVERAHFDGERVYQLIWSPDVDLTVAARNDRPPPEPGTLPFSEGEETRYRVFWTNGSVNVPAGEAQVSVAASPAHDGFRFHVRADTADWVSRFYEADVALETITNDRLLPLTYTETISDGPRRVNRRFEFDHERRQIRIIGAGSPIELPLASHARDPISALFYVRAASLRAGSTFTLPLSDNGRREWLDVTVVGRESVVLNGVARSAWKIEPRVRQIAARRSPPSITVWLSDDDRRVPLVAEVRAVFGAVRMELADGDRARTPGQ